MKAKVGLIELCFKEITRSTKGSFAQSQLFDEEAKPAALDCSRVFSEQATKKYRCNPERNWNTIFCRDQSQFKSYYCSEKYTSEGSLNH